MRRSGTKSPARQIMGSISLACGREGRPFVRQARRGARNFKFQRRGKFPSIVRGNFMTGRPGNQHFVQMLWRAISTKIQTSSMESSNERLRHGVNLGKTQDQDEFNMLNSHATSRKEWQKPKQNQRQRQNQSLKNPRNKNGDLKNGLLPFLTRYYYFRENLVSLWYGLLLV